ncbi:MAG: ATP-binding protein [Lautropia sp.]
MQPPEPGIAFPPAVDAPASPRLRLLVIEDTESDYDLLVHTLRRDGLSARTLRVESAEGVARAFERERWDAVISDHQLPGYSSLEALEQVRALSPWCPFIIVSGVIGEDVAVGAMRRGADDYLVKGRLARLVPSLLNAITAAQARREQARIAEALRASQTALRELLTHLDTAIDAERAEIAREVHDEIGAALTALRLDLDWIGRHGDAASAARAAQSTRTLLGIVGSAQRLQRRLRPPVLDQGLIDGLRWLCEDLDRRGDVRVRFRSNVEAIDVDAPHALAVFRTLQEALTNVSRHAGATRVDVDLHADAEHLSLEVVDDGRGIADADLHKAHSWGLKGLRERAERVGGWIEVSASPGAGTVLFLCLPMPSDATVRTPVGAAS